MAARSCLLIVADYPFLNVDGVVFAEIPWNESLAALYRPPFSKILLLGRLRDGHAAPPGWFPVDTRHYELLDGGDWVTPLGFVWNLPRLVRTLGRVWERVSVIYLKLFYLHSLTAWAYNRTRSPGRRRPVATLLVGDAADAVTLRHDLLPWRWAQRAGSALVSATIRYLQRRVDVAGFWARFLAEKFGSSSAPTLIVNESWLHDAQVRPHDRDRPREPATVLFVGRLVSRKRASLLLDAMARLTRDGEVLRCVIVGDGPDRPALERQAREAGIAERVRFTGWLGLLTPEMLAIYDDADVFCLPSFAEGLPLVIVEAMARGVAVVATAVSGTPEAVEHEHSGLLVPRDDVNALTAAIRRLLHDPELWRRCVQGGYEVARRNTFEVQRGRLARAINGLAR